MPLVTKSIAVSVPFVYEFAPVILFGSISEVFCGLWKKIDRTGEEKKSSFAETFGKFAEVQLQCA